MNHEGSCSRIWFLSTSSFLDDGETKDIWSYLKSKHDTFLGSPIPLQNHVTSPSLPKLGKETGTVDCQSIWNQLAVLMLSFLPCLFVAVPNFVCLVSPSCHHESWSLQTLKLKDKWLAGWPLQVTIRECGQHQKRTRTDPPSTWRTSKITKPLKFKTM